MAKNSKAKTKISTKGGAGKKTNNKGGRPLIISNAKLQKLEYAFSMGCTDLEACVHADISKSTLYNYQKENPEFLERKELLKEKPIMKARKSVVNALTKDPDLALKYLERKKKDEFSLRSEHTGGGGGPINVTKVVREDA